MEEQSFNRIMPHDIEAEQSVLGAMIFDREGLIEASELLRAEDFYRPDHQFIFKGCLELFSAGLPVDLITLKDKMTEMGVIDTVGGLKYLSEISQSVFTSAHIIFHCKIVREKAVLRSLIKAAGDIASMSYDGKDKVDYILDKAEKSVFDIAKNRRGESFASIKEILIENFDKIEKVFLSQDKVTGVKTGFTDFDYKTSGLQPSDLVLIAARPSMGKTAFALNIAQTAAVKNNVTTAIFSLEMSKEQLAHRLLCQEALIDSQKLRTGSLEDEDWINISRAMGSLAMAPIFIDDTPGISPIDIRSKCRKLKLEQNLGLVIIDYLQLMTGSGGKSESRQQEISEISRSLKAIAREMDTPVIALSQLSRACEQRSDHRPMLSDLRESGAIEQDADVVAFLYRDEYYFPDTEKKNIAEVIIAKQRNGPTGSVELIWRSDCTKFENMENGYYGY